MRLLRVITRVNIGGPAKQVTLLHTLIPEFEINQLLVVGETSKWESEIQISPEINFRRVRSLRRGINPIFDLISIFRLVRIIRIEKPEIIHTHLSKSWILTLIAKWLSGSNAKFVHTFHGHIIHSYFNPFVNFILTRIQIIAASRTDKLVAVGNQIIKDLVSKKIGKYEKFVCITPGLIKIDESVPKQESKSDHTFRLLFVGRLEDVKNPKFLISVCKYLKEVDFPFVLTIVGSGSLEKDLVTDATHFQLPIQFEGWQSELDSFYSTHDLLLLCSKNEGTPLVIIEASRFCLPTLSTEVGSVKDLISPDFTGFLSNSDVVAFAEKIVKIAEDRNSLNAVGIQARFHFQDLSSSTEFIDKHLSMYVDLLRHPK